MAGVYLFSGLALWWKPIMDMPPTLGLALAIYGLFRVFKVYKQWKE
jgi:hypothetical protein